MENKIVRYVSLTFLAILTTIILLQLFQIIIRGKFSIEEFAYTALLAEVIYFVPLVIYFYLYNLVRKALVKRNSKFVKIQYKLLLGVGFMLVVVLLIVILDNIVLRGLSLSEMLYNLFDYLIVIAFVPILISLEYIYETKINSE
ncbi:MAG: hypothetical protein ABI203_04885 [Mucilaginibacter sp.]